MKSILDGITILDFTRLLPGPLATMMMGDMGANVIKIEDKNHPDYIRFSPPFINGESANYLALNRSKKSLCVDMKDPAERDIIYKLAEKADLVIEQFRPGFMDKIGFGYEKLKAINEKIIYVSISGYGQTGPYSNKAGHDLNYSAITGITAATGLKEPGLSGCQVSDIAGGSYLGLSACLAALFAREKTGIGQYVDVSMTDGSLPLMTLELASCWATGKNSKRGERELSGGLPNYNIYKCKCGSFIALGSLEPKFWNSFCQFIAKEEWNKTYFLSGKPDPKKDEISKELSKIFLKKSREEWLNITKDLDFCLSSVNESIEISEDPHIKARELIIESEHPKAGKFRSIATPIKFEKTPVRVQNPPPLLGEHNSEFKK